MTGYVFIGPTISREDARAVCDAVWLPPARQGDIYRVAARHRPRAIGIVDGIFQHVPSVWHKEILWAMARGIHVLGAASMGALRAAELYRFGMQGVGAIFEAYRKGGLEPYGDTAFEDDDEVAVIHGPPETGYVALSEAMVNIRCTLAEAQRAGVVGAATRDELARICKAMFYQERSYERLLERAEAHNLPRDQISALRDWLPDRTVDQKHDDALAMLAAMQKLLDATPGPKRVDYDFEHTTLWENAVTRFGTGFGDTTSPEGALPGTDVLAELRLDRDAYLAARRAAVQRMQALKECERQGIDVSRDEQDRMTGEFRRAAGLLTRADMESWLAHNDLDQDGFVRLMYEEARLRVLDAASGLAAEPHLLDDLRRSGHYARLAGRARDKQRVLAQLEAGEAEPNDLKSLRAVIWYFERCLGVDLPTDLTDYARSLGFGGLDAFHRAVLCEYLYRARTGKPVEDEQR